nr:hypothetical protein BgiMline_006020 [Biomphalaria glabrata]
MERSSYQVIRLKYQVIRLKYQVITLKYQVIRLKYQVITLKYQVIRLKYQVITLKYQVITLKFHVVKPFEARKTNNENSKRQRDNIFVRVGVDGVASGKIKVNVLLNLCQENVHYLSYSLTTKAALTPW